ncbi:MAG TPA: signal transduction protein, partial [Phormidium sp.]
ENTSTPLQKGGLENTPLSKEGQGGSIQQRGEQLKAKLKETGRKRIRELVKNPLMLALLCQTFYLDKQGELPETKAVLYERFICYFYEWKQNLHAKDLINQNELKNELHQALGKLALAGINSSARFRLRESLARQEMGKPVFNLACVLGWLNLVERDAQTDESVYAFFHPTFQEYFAALAVDHWDYFLPREHDNRNPKAVRDTYRIFEPQWKEVILLWLGRKDVAEEQKETFIKALIEYKDGCGSENFYGYQAYLLAATGIAEFKKCSLADEIVKQIVNWTFSSFNWKEPQEQTLSLIAKVAKEILPGSERNLLIKQLLSLINILCANQDNKSLEIALEILGKVGTASSAVKNALSDFIHSEDKI